MATHRRKWTEDGECPDPTSSIFISAGPLAGTSARFVKLQDNFVVVVPDAHERLGMEVWVLQQFAEIEINVRREPIRTERVTARMSTGGPAPRAQLAGGRQSPTSNDDSSTTSSEEEIPSLKVDGASQTRVLTASERTRKRARHSSGGKTERVQLNL